MNPYSTNYKRSKLWLDLELGSREEGKTRDRAKHAALNSTAEAQIAQWRGKVGTRKLIDQEIRKCPVYISVQWWCSVEHCSTEQHRNFQNGVVQ